MVIRVGELEALGVDAGLVGRIDVAASVLIGLEHFLLLFEGHDLIGHVVGLEIVGEVEFGRCARLGADGSAIELERAVHAERLLHQEALAVIIHDACEFQTERGVAAHRPRRVARQDVDFAGLQRGEALLGRKRREFHLGRVVEDSRGKRPAEIDVEAGPVVLFIRETEADEARIAAALDKSLGLDVIKRSGRSRRNRSDAEAYSQSQ